MFLKVVGSEPKQARVSLESQDADDSSQKTPKGQSVEIDIVFSSVVRLTSQDAGANVNTASFESRQGFFAPLARHNKKDQNTVKE